MFYNSHKSDTHNETNCFPSCPTRTGLSLDTIPITEEIVLKQVIGLSPNSSPGPDGINNKMLIEGGSSLIKALCRLFSLSMNRGEIPSDWKIANVIPIHKKGSRTDCGNYRPVSLTSCVCKLMERVIKVEISRFLSVNNLLSNTQHGFISKRSTSTALLQYLEKVTLAIDSGNFVDSVYIDFRKAFDSVPYKRLIIKLKSYGILGSLLNWFISFLTDRLQFVTIGHCSSSFARVISGVPQGSVIGPLLFLMFVDDVDDCVSHSAILKFADDIKLFCSFSVNDPSLCPNALQCDLSRLVTWSKEWLLQINFSKCKCLHFGKNNPSVTYVLDDVPIMSADEELDLGVLISKDLKPSKECFRIATRANKILGCIKMSFKYLDIPTLRTLYKAFVRPLLDYCSVVWSPYFVKDIEVLEKIQRRMTRLLPSVRHLSYEERLSRFCLTTLKTRRVRYDLLFMFKIFTGHIDIPFDDLFIPSSITWTRGHPFKLRHGFSRTLCRKYFFTQRVVSLWNSLPQHFFVSSSVSLFKSQVDEYLFKHGYR